MSNDRKEIIVIGAGVIGLSTAIRLQETGKYSVTVIAEIFPTDPRTIRYTSHWAGAHHVSRASGDVRQKELDKETFETMWRDSEPNQAGTVAGLFRHTHTELHGNGVDPSAWLDYMPNFRTTSEHEFIPGAAAAYTFTTISLNAAVYLNWLFGRFLSGGGSTKRVNLQHISQVLDSATVNPAAIVACPGIGARFLGGIEDKDVYPIRGQTILLRAPWVEYGKGFHRADGSYIYVIPQNTGNVLIGGIRVPDDWYPVPRAADRTYILERVLELCPDLAPPSVRATRKPTTEDLEALIIDEGCGLRPGRRGGIRLEVGSLERTEGGKTPVVYNYGHTGVGFQSSWGSASVALQLLEDAIRG